MWGDDAFAVGDGLLAEVVVGDEVEIGLRDFDEVAEDLVVADFEVFDAGPFTFLCLVCGDPVLSFGGGAAEGVELFVVAVSEHAAVLDGDGGLVDDGAFDEVGEGGLFGHGGTAVVEERVAGGGEDGTEVRDDGECAFEDEEVTGVGVADVESCDDAFDVPDGLEGVVDFGVGEWLFEEALDGVEASVDGVFVEERSEEPFAEES